MCERLLSSSQPLRIAGAMRRPNRPPTAACPLIGPTGATLTLPRIGCLDGCATLGSGQVRGFCKDLSNPEVFDRVNVRGDIRFSDIHHHWFGL